MIISHAHRFIFLKTKKTAGTSIEVFLSQVCGDGDVVTPILPHVEPHRARNHEGFYNHMAATDVRAVVGPRVWARYRTFCVERHVWDRVVSHYYFLLGAGRIAPGFDAYLEHGPRCHNRPIYTHDGTVIVDRVLRYERLTDELHELFGELGIAFEGDLGVRAKGDARPPDLDYRDAFTPAQAALVAELYADEIAMHGYRF